jgi:hypothetical protein
MQAHTDLNTSITELKIISKTLSKLNILTMAKRSRNM